MPSHDETRWTETEAGVWTRHYEEQAEAGPDATAGAVEAAEELGVDLASVSGTGKDGKITKADVEHAAHSK